MNKQTEALKMALEALQNVYFENEQLSFVDNAESNWKQRQNAIKACKEALAQPAQEPVAWNEEEFNAIAYAYRTCPAHEIKMVSDRYQELVNYVLSITHPAPSWQGLSDDEIQDAWYKLYPLDKNNLWDDMMIGKHLDKFAHAIEQALKEKNHVRT